MKSRLKFHWPTAETRFYYGALIKGVIENGWYQVLN